MPFEIVYSDIIKMKVDAIVNAANSALQMGGGVCGAIFIAAGAARLQAACDGIGYCAPGDAVLTDAFGLQAKYIIHTVGPVWYGGSHQEERVLASAYGRSLELAAENRCSSIAFPLISAGIFGYPKDLALKVAMDTIMAFLETHEMDIFLVLHDR